MMLCRSLLLLTFGFCTVDSYGQTFSGSASYSCYQAALSRSLDLTACNRAIDEQNLTRFELAANYSNRALMLAGIGDLPSAFADHEKALELEPGNGHALINRANTYFLAEQFTAALRDLDVAIAVGGAVLAVAYYNRGIVHARIGNNEFARQDAQRAIALNPDSEAYKTLFDSLTTSSRNTP